MKDRETLRPFLDADPIANAVVWNRVYQVPDYREVFVDGLPPKAILGVDRADSEDHPSGLMLHAVDPVAATAVAEAIPSGPAFLHLTEEWILGVLEPRAARMEARSAWLFRLEAKDFVDLQRHEVRPVTPDAAGMIAKLWEPDWPAEDYVRRRIQDGPTAGIYADGQLVAWTLTHFETDRVGMMGFLHVLEGHRGKGYAKSVSSALVKDLLRRGKIPALHIFADNVASLELTPQLGFRRVKRQVWGDAVFR